MLISATTFRTANAIATFGAVLLPLLLLVAWGCGGGGGSNQPRGGDLGAAGSWDLGGGTSERSAVGLRADGQPSEGVLAERADQQRELGQQQQQQQEQPEQQPGAEGENDPVEDAAAVGSEYPFSARTMRFHPFTRVRRRVPSGDATSDVTLPNASALVIEARLEFFDQFGDPTKAIGRLRFELYESEPGHAGVPIPGRRLMQWDPDFHALDVNATFYDNITRTYVFRLDTAELDLEQLPNNEQCVMIATFHTRTRRMAAQFDLDMLR